ncbi:MAG: tol-pal system protein YbgF [Desulfobacteraceae bacterium]|jgi:tol-pal system protein YbgF
MKLYLIITVTLSCLLTGCMALQQDVAILEERLLAVEFNNQKLQEKNRELQKELQRDLDTLGETRKSSERGLRAQVAGMNANMESMQQQVRLLKGRVEELEFIINRKIQGYEATDKSNRGRLDEVSLSVSKIDRRLIQLEQYLNISGKNGQPSPARPAAGLEKPKRQADRELYDKARQAYDNGDMDKARQGFQKLIDNHPKSTEADNAQFWIGESYYREKWYERAILEFQTVIEKYPKGNKVPAAMLKQGLALLQIGEKSSARLILKELVKKYPKAPESEVAAKKLKEF